MPINMEMTRTATTVIVHVYDTKNSKSNLNLKENTASSSFEKSASNNTQVVEHIALSAIEQEPKNLVDKKERARNHTELKGVQNLKHLWNSRISAIKQTSSFSRLTLSPAKSCGNLLTNDKSTAKLARVASLHNCADYSDTPNGLTSKYTKDNFYKHKTAATIENNRNNSLSPTSPPRQILPEIRSFNFPMVGSTGRGDKIHWVRRDEMVRQKNNIENHSPAEQARRLEMNLLPPSTKEKPLSIDLHPSTISVTEPSIICDSVNRDETMCGCGIPIDTDSNCSSPVDTLTPRKKNTNVNRKYSFKTQVKSYHSPRKVPQYASNTVSNKVAKLTQQFNEIIQKDKTILDEVKRNNGILISRGTHVYKVVQNSKTTPTPGALEGSSSSGTPNNSTVQRAIKTFESKTIEKPRVPIRSAQVLRKKKELVHKKESKSKALEQIQEEIQVAPKRTEGDKEKHSDNENDQLELQKLENLPSTLIKSCELELHKRRDPLHTKKADHQPDFVEQKPTVAKDMSPSENFNLLKPDRQSEEPETYAMSLETTTNSELDNGKAPQSPHSTEYFLSTSPAFPSNNKHHHPQVSDQSQFDENHINITSELSGESAQLDVNVQSLTELDDQLSSQFGSSKNFCSLEEPDLKVNHLVGKVEEIIGIGPDKLFISPSSCDINEDELNQAVNTGVINLIQSQALLTKDLNGNLHPSNEINSKKTDVSVTTPNEEDSYEDIIVNTKPHTDEQQAPQPQKSFLYCKQYAKSKQEKPTTNTAQNYESCAIYESINGSCESTKQGEHSYESCEVPKSTLTSSQRAISDIPRNTTDELPELPKPKRIIPKKPAALPLMTGTENIYDSIRGGHYCYEPLESSKPKPVDTISLTSNGYESITSYQRQPSLRNAGSSSTISSDHKTNSLYEASILNGMLTGCYNHSQTYITSSENSDDWVDISDSEGNTYDMIEKQPFIVVRELKKCHRSPDWSKRVRDERLNQAVSDDDDVNHYYEPLFSLNNKINAKSDTTAATQETYSPTSNDNITPYMTEDYDSFDSDDEVVDVVQTLKQEKQLDISTSKLPNPPPSKNQVYAFVRKFRNLISSKKSPSDPNKSFLDGVPTKMYENAQFQLENNDQKNMLKPIRKAPELPKTPKIKTRKDVEKANQPDENVYENADFSNSKLSISNQGLPELVVQSQIPERNLSSENDISTRSKSKIGKSFKSRLKSFGSSHNDYKQPCTLTAARSTFYVSDSNANEQDSGIFEKTPSNELFTDEIQKPKNDPPPATNVRKNKKDSSNSNAYRRRTTIGIRPNDPPPPPPILLDDSKNLKERISTTSWYDECGVFKMDNSINNADRNCEKQTSHLTRGTSGTSWYAEAGLYQTSGVSVASSSGSSGISTETEGGTFDEIGQHVFLNEPFYQIYNAEKLQSITRDMEDHESVDGYEEVGVNGQTTKTEQTKSTRPTALQLIGPKTGPSRTLWSEIPEVVASEILRTLTPRERSLQEAKFEIITSEASYLKSLNLLRSHFINFKAFHDTTVLSPRDRKTLFSNIVPVHECSEKLLYELEKCWQDNIMLLGLSKSIYDCAEKNFHVYISYCEHQGKMDRALRRLKEENGTFCRKLDALESDPTCCGLNIHSFLMLPMQRITRLPLLIDAVFSKLHSTDGEYESWKLTLSILNKIVAQCNEAANRCEQAYELERISKQLEFPSHIRSLSIAQTGTTVGVKPRFLVKRGELVHLIWRSDDAKLTFGKKINKSNIYAFLFSDLMILTKRKGEAQFTVFDYCPRNMLTISSGDSVPQLPIKDAGQMGKNLILMTLLENHDKKTVELVLSCPSVSEMERWLQATRPPEAETPGEKLYEQWDCPQVIAKHLYIANEPDLLSLEIGDVVNVTRKLPDGWFNGERIRDGAIGWFPGSFTEEVNSAHVRARNLKQRYRLLTFTATYLESQKRKEKS